LQAGAFRSILCWRHFLTTNPPPAPEDYNACVDVIRMAVGKAFKNSLTGAAWELPDELTCPDDMVCFSS
jgi:hypothetical protein